jgi:hypothetical protein
MGSPRIHPEGGTILESHEFTKANERHAKLGFVAAGIFPPPVEYMSNIKLPAGIPAKGTTPSLHIIESDRMGRVS